MKNSWMFDIQDSYEVLGEDHYFKYMGDREPSTVWYGLGKKKMSSDNYKKQIDFYLNRTTRYPLALPGDLLL